MASQSVEVTEAEYPLQILSYEFVADRAGAGRYRGGTPFRRDYRFLEIGRAAAGALRPPRLPPLRALRRQPRPALAQRHEPGRTASARCRASSPRPSGEGDVFRHELAGAGGYGDPLEREPQAVLRDLRNELIGEAAARDDYGVIVDRAAVAGR